MAYQVLGDFSAYIEARRRGEPPLPAHLGWRSYVRKGGPMPDPKSSQSSSAAKDTSAPAKASLAPAAESGDPEVHRLLAERATAQSNLDAATPDETLKARADQAREQLEAIDKQLADLGFSAG